MRSLDDDIAKLRNAIVSSGDFHSLLVEIVENYGSSSFAQLLSMEELPEFAGNARYAITHTVESMPTEAYVALFIDSTPRMQERCPQFFGFLLGRIIASDAHYSVLVGAVKGAEGPSKIALAKEARNLEKEAEDEQLDEYQKKCSSLIEACK